MRMALGQAGFSFKVHFGDAPPVTAYVGRTWMGRGLFLDQKRVAARTVVATAAGVVVDKAALPRSQYALPIRSAGKVTHYFVLHAPTLAHPGNLINSVIVVKNPPKGAKRPESANVTLRHDPALNLAVFTTTRALRKGTEFKADYSGDKGLRAEMIAARRAWEAERAAHLAAEGRSQHGQFTSASATVRRCPHCARDFGVQTPRARFSGHVVGCAEGGGAAGQ